ncbi:MULTISPECIES: lasso peptide biosynthesis PqqD family chaperone [unclassified Streptomyces]|uniref:lasso peptide biosynthesis PqqD family chaperone n=1 Tax=unclassified Streptomyces TaxID=2593676 RepID=UPI0020363C8C|nr:MULTISPECIES: lasso peptide biosynthesis PqqD family chaperone [unclassified Streptomyces]
MSRLHADVTCTTTEDGMVLLNQRTGRYWQLNATGATVLQAFLNGSTLQQISDALVQARPVSREHAEADVNALIDHVTRAGLVSIP